MGKFIDQQKNYAADFGAAYRSSAIFFKPSRVKTTLSISNYWEFKNNLSVGLVVSFRHMDGQLSERRELSFGDLNVLNIEIDFEFEGSVEVEAFSSSNLRIPYAAIMCVYETNNSVSMVHSYGRNHSLIELEDSKAVVEGRESCWSLSSRASIKNLAVFHNGHVSLDQQSCVFTITREDGEERSVDFELRRLMPFETVIFDMDEIDPCCREFLNLQNGWGTLHFESRSSFTRLLVMWIDAELDEIQVTHSNFDYSAHSTDVMDSSMPALMVLPLIDGKYPDVVVYPKFSGEGFLTGDGIKIKTGCCIDGGMGKVSFKSLGSELPSRIVTALRGSISSQPSIPFECSLGVVHEQRPAKRFHWFMVSPLFESKIHITCYSEIYPLIGALKLVAKLYSDTSSQIIEKNLNFNSLAELPAEISICDLFDCSGISQFGYVSIFSEYGGLFIFSSMRKRSSITIEHSF